MQDQRKLLRLLMTEYETRLSGVTAYIRELRDMVKKHGTEEKHYKSDLDKAEQDAEYYGSEIKRISKALRKRLAKAASQKHEARD